MATLQPKDWLFLIPYPDEDSFLFYAPLHGFATKVTLVAKEQLELIIEAVSNGRSLDGFSPVPVQFVNDNGLLLLPDGVSNPRLGTPGASGITLSLTNDCNLRCIYCYASAGLDITTLPKEVAFNAIEYGLKLAQSIGRKSFILTFHGGGESLVRKDLFKACVIHAREQATLLGLSLSIHLVTNATLISATFAKWMKAHGVVDVTVSLDGSEKIQNLQRPMIKGKGSFRAAMRGIANLKNVEIPFSIRATVTSKSVREMPDFVRFLAENVFTSGEGTVHFEPISLCGKAKDSEELDVMPVDYVFYYREARQVGTELGIRVTCTLDTFKRDTLQYCGASFGTMFCVCPGGEVSACSRITKKQDRGSELFFYGAFDANSAEPVMDSSAHQRIVEHGGLPLNPCAECFARWNCQGFCPIARYLGENTFGESCIILKQMLLQDIAEAF